MASASSRRKNSAGALAIAPKASPKGPELSEP